jgi:outer membrane protein
MRGGLLAAAAVTALVVAGAAEAETLREALVQVYKANPTISAQRAQLRSLDEAASVTRAGLRPQVSATVGVNQDVLATGRAGTGRNLTGGIDVAYPLFNGGRVRSQIRAADTRVEAGRANLRATEGDVFTEGVGAYMDVIRDRTIVTLNEGQTRVLETNLQASRDRFEGGRPHPDRRGAIGGAAFPRPQQPCDGAGAPARQRGELPARDRQLARGSSAAEPAPAAAAQPRRSGRDRAREQSGPRLHLCAGAGGGLRHFGGARRSAADDQRGQHRPLSERARHRQPAAGHSRRQPDQCAQQHTTAGLGVQARIPLYQGGLVGARVRQAQALQSQLLEQGVAVERGVVANVRAAYASFQASLEAIRSNEVAVAATTSRSKACGRNRASAPATCWTCSMPSRSS